MADPLQYATAAEFQAHAIVPEALRNLETPVIDAALQWASRKASGYIAKRKVLPLKSWGSDIKDAVCELALYRLMSRKGYAPGSGANDTIREAFLDALDWLTNVSKGLAELVDCVDSSTTPDIDEAGPLAESDEIVNWNYQTRGRGRCYP